MPTPRRAPSGARPSARPARSILDVMRDSNLFGPLFRPALWRLAEDDHALMLGMHHSISYGWSIGVLARDFAELSTALEQTG